MFISNENYQLIEQFIYLPLVSKILHRDRQLIEKAPFKIKEPYLHIVENALTKVEKDFTELKIKLKQNRITVTKKGSNEAFTLYEFNINGQTQDHSFYHPVMKNKTTELLEGYLKEQPFLTN